ncbi:Something about silencing protein, putative [Pediculus humanus corporis]|uniref:Something about silencing protein, putative n=1 Tax=Pediculus humanus subsp. corporis TaxID=121224 RepID=E0VE77_PEDHC|nr:Something about silencing protein, putative [Pediculus humanus corporis]EEB11683.1 Something about silencing protein, putative [Pediculus humanus corporis]
MESDEYNVTDSEDDYSEEEKVLLEKARDSMREKDISTDEEVYGFDGSDSEDENDKLSDIDMGSDIEEEEKLPDERAWGKKKKSFYSTDFVDQDYDGIYQGQEAEIAELEEQEAKNIQKRLTEQLNEADFSISELVNLAEASESASKEIIQTDLSKLSKREKLDLVKKESPEFFALIQDYKEKLEEAQNFMPVINYFKNKMKKSFPALEFLQTKLTIILNYCTNISFYLYLKAKRIPIKNHPILKSLFKYRQLLQQMNEIDMKVIKPELKNILKLIESGKEIEIDEEIISHKPILKLLTKKQKQQQLDKSNMELTDEEDFDENDRESIDEEESEERDDNQENLNEKRAITYEMAKNKGLTPKRKKELRNPRVKNRRKYEKAKIRRKGQVRLARKEIPSYGGELSGIKTFVTKSIKFK